MNAIPHDPQQYKPFATVAPRHRIEVIPSEPKAAAELLDRFASEGWQLFQVFQVPVQQSRLAGNNGMAIGLYCILARLEQRPVPSVDDVAAMASNASNDMTCCPGGASPGTPIHVG